MNRTRSGSRNDEYAWVVLILVALIFLAVGAPNIRQVRDTVTGWKDTVVVKMHGGRMPPPRATDAAKQLAGLPVKPEHPAGYQRSLFGPAWADVDHNGCDTRNDILARDLTDIVKSGSCTVLSGTLHDPYTGKTIAFVRGIKTSNAVQVDHIVPLYEAWRSGAWNWHNSPNRSVAQYREQYANDPLVLQAVDGPTNEAKGDDDPSRWLPAHDPCTYVRRYIQIKAKYRLSVDPAEYAALSKTLAAC